MSYDKNVGLNVLSNLKTGKCMMQELFASLLNFYDPLFRFPKLICKWQNWRHFLGKLQGVSKPPTTVCNKVKRIY